MLKEFDDSFRINSDLVLGIDEAGRGPLFGPLIVAGVVLDSNFNHPLINDSKQLNEKKRNILYDYIIENAIDIFIEIISVEEIDELNILGATKKGMKNIIEKSDCDIILVDAVKLNMGEESIIKGDAKSLAIASASIIAKVTRDNLIKEMGKDFLEFSFDKHKGYSTKKHMEELKEFGATKYHRKSFKPVMDEINRGNLY